MQPENHQYYLHERTQDGGHLTCIGHVQEYAEDVDGQQRDNHIPDHHVYNLPQLIEQRFDGAGGEERRPQPDYERRYKRRHHTQQRRHAYCKIWRDGRSARGRSYILRRLNHRRKQPHTGEIGYDTGQHGKKISQQYSDHEHFAGPCAYVGYGRRHESHDNQRDAEAKELAEYGVERSHCPGRPFRRNPSHPYSKGDGNQDSGQ